MAKKPSKPVILYAQTELNGILARPDSRGVVRKAIEGHPIEVRSGNDYINLYHVFERLQLKDKALAKLAMVRRQIGSSRWLVGILPAGADFPDVELDEGYDPKRGRYKRYAEQLAAGDALRFNNRQEAIKARRAWQLYVPAAQRKHLRGSVRRIGKSEAFLVIVTERAGG